jgi:CRP/FNR family cyclic AMP-dependent transcriptional regulator
MLSFLETVAPYNTLDEQGLQSLANIAIRRNYKKNMVIIQQGDDTNSMFILIEGEMRVYVEDEEGKQLTVRILNPGHSFGEVALIGDFPRTASVMTLTDSVVAAFSRERYGCIALSDVYGRVTHILEKYAVEADDHRRVPKFTHREIAGMIGSSREMVSKILKELETGDYISVTSKHYVINKNLPANW